MINIRRYFELKGYQKDFRASRQGVHLWMEQFRSVCDFLNSPKFEEWFPNLCEYKTCADCHTADNAYNMCVFCDPSMEVWNI